MVPPPARVAPPAMPGRAVAPPVAAAHVARSEARPTLRWLARVPCAAQREGVGAAHMQTQQAPHPHRCPNPGTALCDDMGSAHTCAHPLRGHSPIRWECCPHGTAAGSSGTGSVIPCMQREHVSVLPCAVTVAPQLLHSKGPIVMSSTSEARCRRWPLRRCLLLVIVHEVQNPQNPQVDHRRK